LDNGSSIENNTIPKNSSNNKKFIAEWDIVYYQISYDNLNGADNSSNPTMYTIEDEFNLYELVLQGYYFLGWSDGGTIPLGSTGDKTFLARWATEVYYLYFFEEIAGGDSIKVAAIEYGAAQFGTYVDIPDLSRKGYRFLGWYDKDDPNLTLLNDKIYIPDIGLGDVEYYASLEIVEYSIDYVLVANGEDSSTVTNPNKTIKYTIESEQIVIMLQPATRAGYTFVGWFLDENYTQRINKITIGLAMDIKLYASWQKTTPDVVQNVVIYNKKYKTI